jgi:CxxC motif-containing protein (DUF1111 family)
MRYFLVLLFFGLAVSAQAQQKRQQASAVSQQRGQEAPTGFDDKSNGMVDEVTHASDKDAFDEVENIDDGLGPLYNAQSCRECHQNPVSGAASQVTELRVGHRGPDGRFRNPRIPIARGTEVITGRSLVNDRAICPNGEFPDSEIQQRVPISETVRTFRLSLNLLGDGFIEAIADETLIALARNQCEKSGGKICGQVIHVPLLEAPGETRVGRFGWKNQQASLLSFSADAYLNEMGITSRLQPDEVTNTCNTVSQPNNKPGADGLEDIDKFTRFMRATKAPPRDQVRAATRPAKRGEQLFEKIGCAMCHTATLTSAPAGTIINGGKFTVPAALGDKTFHPYSDFLLHDVGTGDGIVMAMEEHYGKNVYSIQWNKLSLEDLDKTQFKMRTPPLWGVRMRPRLMHDGATLTLLEAVRRHAGAASDVTTRFNQLTTGERDAVLEFLRSL